MKYLSFFILFLAMAAGTTAYGTEGYAIGDIKLVVTGFRNNAGALKIALVNSEQSYLARKGGIPAFRTASVDVTGDQVRYVFKNVSYGEYAVKLYHDENGNSELDTNFIGVPTEGYGFSNNARAIGMPGYAKTRFYLDSKEVTLTIEVR